MKYQICETKRAFLLEFRLSANLVGKLIFEPYTLKSLNHIKNCIDKVSFRVTKMNHYFKLGIFVTVLTYVYGQAMFQAGRTVFLVLSKKGKTNKNMSSNNIVQTSHTHIYFRKFQPVFCLHHSKTSALEVLHLTTHNTKPMQN